MIQQTSIDAFNSTRPKIGKNQHIVYNAILGVKDEFGVTNMELSVSLGWSINRVTPRVLELRKMGYVRKCCVRPCKITGSMSLAWMEHKTTYMIENIGSGSIEKKFINNQG